jgi:ribonuclease P protein component
VATGSAEYGFSGTSRLKTPYDFFQARQDGRRFQTTHFIRYCLANSGGPTRLGVTVSRKVGCAVIRNRIKRLLREFFRLHRKQLPLEMDYSVIAKKGAGTLSNRQIFDEIKTLFVS